MAAQVDADTLPTYIWDEKDERPMVGDFHFTGLLFQVDPRFRKRRRRYAATAVPLFTIRLCRSQGFVGSQEARVLGKGGLEAEGEVPDA
mmetsp:Transcript_108562/g.315779  ORF Transcript_108562/g.315779 Transcript_108562/m.315779 type:complete len:89 (+) Transcript_108562:71-337(+)